MQAFSFFADKIQIPFWRRRKKTICATSIACRCMICEIVHRSLKSHYRQLINYQIWPDTVQNVCAMLVLGRLETFESIFSFACIRMFSINAFYERCICLYGDCVALRIILCVKIISTAEMNYWSISRFCFKCHHLNSNKNESFKTNSNVYGELMNLFKIIINKLYKSKDIIIKFHWIWSFSLLWHFISKRRMHIAHYTSLNTSPFASQS